MDGGSSQTTQPGQSFEGQYQTKLSCLGLHRHLGQGCNLDPVCSKMIRRVYPQSEKTKLLTSADLCSPSCGPGGICLAQSCSCLTGFTGTTCSECSPGFFGPNCQPCSSQCPGKCHDGLGGSGGCMGSAGNSSSSCNCLAGTCTSGNTCQCAAGWGNSKVGLCDVCAPGFFLDHGNCLACPLGATGCSSGTTLTACATGYSLTASGICQQQGSSASCTDGQYWNGASCSRSAWALSSL